MTLRVCFNDEEREGLELAKSFITIDEIMDTIKGGWQNEIAGKWLVEMKDYEEYREWTIQPIAWYDGLDDNTLFMIKF